LSWTNTLAYFSGSKKNVYDVGPRAALLSAFSFKV